MPGSDSLKRVVGGRSARAVWLGATVLAGAAIVGTTLAGSGALRREEEAAGVRAEAYTKTVLFTAVSEDVLDAPISGDDRRALLIDVQAGIMTDERVARVQIWSPDGKLLFSTVERAKEGESPSAPAGPIRDAAEGATVSLVTEASVAPQVWLPGQVRQLHETFVPLRVQGRAAVVGVAQIDQLEDELRAEAAGFWRPVQLVAGAVLAIFAVLTLAAFRTAPAPRQAARTSTLDQETSPAPIAETEQGEPATTEEHEVAALDEASGMDEHEAAEEAVSAAEELEAARQQLRQAEEAYRWLNVKARQSEERAQELEGQVQGLQGRLEEGEAARAEAAGAEDAERTRAVEDAIALAEERARAAEEELRRSESMRTALEEQMTRADEGLRAVEERLRLAEQRSDRAAALRSRLAAARPLEDEEPRAASE